MRDQDVGRRDFMGLLAGCASLVSMAGCSRGTREKIVPYVVQPPEAIPGVPRHYATAMAIDGYAVGLVVESHEGRPTKIEGNPEHPASLGGSGAFEQAAILGLYDPRRARGVREGHAPSTWEALTALLAKPIPAGKEMHVVLEPTASPLTASLLTKLRAARPEVRVHFHAPLSRDAAWEGARFAFGRVLETHIEIAKADILVSLDSDFLTFDPARLAAARAFASRRRPEAGAMNRMYVAEPSLTVTGMAADHRLAMRRSEIAPLAAALLGYVRDGVPQGAGDSPREAWIRAAARDVRSAGKNAAILVGTGEPPEVHAAAHGIHASTGALGHIVKMREPAIVDAGGESHGLHALAEAIDRGVVDTLLILGPDIAYSAHADLEMARRIRDVPRSVHISLYEDVTSRVCHWHAPLAHTLESWGDARAFDGTVSLVQPLIDPLFDGRTADEILNVILGRGDRAHPLTRDAWRAALSDAAWNDALARGTVEGALPVVAATCDVARIRDLARATAAAAPLELSFTPDARVHDGRFANNAWLLELPDPVTKLTWGNAARIAPITAARMGIANGDVLELTVRGRSLNVPALLVPGEAEGAIALSLGYGGEIAGGAGGDALRTGASPWNDAVTVRRTGAREDMALTQLHASSEGRAPARRATLNELHAGLEREKTPLTLYRGPALTAAHQWGMSIDLAACTGCSACVVACQAENNVPVVGKDGVLKGRAMHWIRIDRYFEKEEAALQPMLCQHCERAPCEYVCPVGATVHSPDGLNEMTYNRCVGTRFCSNNCPYKVRRFNWFDYQADKDEMARLVFNPDVTVRERGVMEKCTYCVQRIREKERHAKREGRDVRDGEIRTACEQACPSQAITFGSIADPNSAVSREMHNTRSYTALNELGTLPRTRYMTRITNPSPDLRGK